MLDRCHPVFEVSPSPVDEPRRIALHRAAAESWDEEAADTLVEFVTPAGQGLATRADIPGVLSAMEAMEQRWDERFQTLDERWDQRLEATEHRITAAFERGLREAITTQTRVIVVSLLVALVTIAGLAIALP